MRDKVAPKVEWPCLSFLGLLLEMTTNRWLQITDTHSLAVWRPGVQSQGVGGAMLPPKALGEETSLPLPASSGHITPIFVGVRAWPPSLSVSFRVVSSS